MLTRGLSVSRETSDRLARYVDELLRWQDRMNLIGPATREEVWQRHIADSWQIASLIPSGSSVVDMGSGAGLPGIMIAIRMREEGKGHVTAVETNGKKCAFLNHVRRELFGTGEERLSVRNERVETFMPTLAAGGVVTARAFASLVDLLDHASLAPDANHRRHLFPKGRSAQIEIDAARRKFSFDLEIVKSQIANDSAILDITNLRRL